MTGDKYQELLRTYWGYEDFRGIQRNIIDSIVQGHDTLGLMPTGGGKSITFQVPALSMHGVCLVITPLIALMKDQVSQLRRRGIRAAAIHSGMHHDEVVTTLENAIFGGIKLLYISPERLGSELFLKKLSHMHVSFITVDEAHCISQWGYDFRPAYLEINRLRTLKPEAPVLALTATATPHVVVDIQRQLHFRDGNVFSMSFERKNLAYMVQKASDKDDRLLHILRTVEGCAIVYVRSRKRTKEIADLLMKNDISALSYNAGLDNVIRNLRQEEWQNGNVRVMVATNAFGMGIDKPDVRLVIHMDCPDSPEAYFQEAGRAGRDGEKSYAILLYNRQDSSKLHKRIDDNFPLKDDIRKVYEHLAYYYQIAVGDGRGVTHDFDIDEFCRRFHHFPVRVDAALHLLERSGYIHYEENADNSARVHFLVSRHQLDRLNDLDDHQHRLIVALLRNYGGLFSNYEYINELQLAKQTGMQPQLVYVLLKTLSQRRILHFIPHRKIPSITYLQRREETERVVIPPSVYEERKEQFQKRIEAVIDYAETDNICRSRLLLRYFGETRSCDCGQCDVCLAHKRSSVKSNVDDEAESRILDLLADGKLHLITDINAIALPSDSIDRALTHLAAEEHIAIINGMIKSTTSKKTTS